MDILMNKFYLFFLVQLIRYIYKNLLRLIPHKFWELLYTIPAKIRQLFSTLIHYDNILLNFGSLISR